jgi:hypothetical protein
MNHNSTSIAAQKLGIDKSMSVHLKVIIVVAAVESHIILRDRTFDLRFYSIFRLLVIIGNIIVQPIVGT